MCWNQMAFQTYQCTEASHSLCEFEGLFPDIDYSQTFHTNFFITAE